MKAAPIEWELVVDEAWFVPLPPPGDETAWIERMVARALDDTPGTDADRAAVRDVATAMVDLRTDEATRLWFAPVGALSDVLVTIMVTPSADLGSVSLEDVLGGVGSATSGDVVEVRTDRHGGGYLVRRTDETGGDVPELVAQWTLRLGDGRWSILVDAIGRTLPMFGLYERMLPSLLDGIILPEPGAADAVVHA